MLEDYLLDRHRSCGRLDVHDEPVQERLRVRLVPGGNQPIDHASSFRRCLDEVPKTHTERVRQASYWSVTIRIPVTTGMDRIRLSSPVLGWLVGFPLPP